MLGRKWPEKYNATGYLRWAGRLYGRGLPRLLGWRRERVFHGTWGKELFQSLYQPASGGLGNLPLMPEWHLLGLAFAALAVLGVDWPPLSLFLYLFLITLVASLLQAGLSAAHAQFARPPGSSNAEPSRLMPASITSLLYLIQPLARVSGRLSHVGALRKKRAPSGLPRPITSTVWSEIWRAPDAWLRSVEVALQGASIVSIRGGDYDRWDLEVRGGLLGSSRTLLAIEEHGGGRQLVRFRTWPRCSSPGVVVIAVFALLCGGAALDHAWVATAILGAVAAALALRMLWECSVATAAILNVVRDGDNVITPPAHVDEQGTREV